LEEAIDPLTPLEIESCLVTGNSLLILANVSDSNEEEYLSPEDLDCGIFMNDLSPMKVAPCNFILMFYRVIRKLLRNLLKVKNVLVAEIVLAVSFLTNVSIIQNQSQLKKRGTTAIKNS